jgi:soluble lytic murein transglycosylase-like protein
VPSAFVHSVAKAESAYRTGAISHKGAIGLMQLMPATAQALKADPYDPKQNAEAGVRYLKELLIKYDHSARLALAAYNAGPGAVDRYSGVPPYGETRRYVDRVIRDYLKSKPKEEQR